jgi:phosphatidate cytidylyltransferase
MSNLAARLLTAALVVPFLILAINWQSPLAVQLIVLAASAVGLREWMGMTLQTSTALDRWWGILVGTAVAAVFIFLGETPMAVPAAAAGATLAVLIFHLFRLEPIETVATRAASMLTGVLYVGLLGFLAHLKARQALHHDGGAWVYIALVIAWLSDTGAYFAGRFLGPRWPRKLYPTVSPKKTVVGSVGGVVGSYLGVMVVKLWLLPEMSWLDTVLVAVPANVLGQLGDLCESLVKRSVGVKDSGALLPGHGGMLDRIDALLFVTPYVYCYARWIY